MNVSKKKYLQPVCEFYRQYPVRTTLVGLCGFCFGLYFSMFMLKYPLNLPYRIPMILIGSGVAAVATYYGSWYGYSTLLSVMSRTPVQQFLKTDALSYGPTIVLLGYGIQFMLVRPVFFLGRLLLLLACLGMFSIKFLLSVKYRNAYTHRNLFFKYILPFCLGGCVFMLTVLLAQTVYRMTCPYPYARLTVREEIVNGYTGTYHIVPVPAVIDNLVSVPSDGFLSFGLGIADHINHKYDSGIECVITLNDGRQPETAILSTVVSQSQERIRGIEPYRLDLSSYAGQEVMLTMTLKGRFGYLLLEGDFVPQPGDIESLVMNAAQADPPAPVRSLTCPHLPRKKIKIKPTTRNAIVAFPPSDFTCQATISEPAALDVSFGILEHAWFREHGDGVVFEVFVQDDSGEKRSIFQQHVDPIHNKHDRKWFTERIDVSQYVDHDLTFVFETSSPTQTQDQSADLRFDYAVWGEPLLRPRRKLDAPNVLLISLDTFRADHAGCYGYHKNTTPHIDTLARQGVVFETAISQAPWTAPSHMAMFTGLYPSQLGIDNLPTSNIRLDDDVTTLVELLQQQGYQTTAFSSGVLVAAELGFAQGFDEYSDHPPFPAAADIEQRYESLSSWLRDNKENQFFVFVHSYELHAPYNRSQYFKKMYPGTFDKEIDWTVIEHPRSSPVYEQALKDAGVYDKDFTMALYDSGIKYTDVYIGKIMQLLRELELFENTLIIITSDHGEEFADHYPDKFYNAHSGYSLYDELLRVPLIMVYPSRLPQGFVIREQVRLIDIMPTVLDILDIPYDSKMSGVSVLPLIDQSENLDLIAYSESAEYGIPQKKSIRTATYKYIYTFTDTEKTPIQEELYHIDTDPAERENRVQDTAFKELQQFHGYLDTFFHLRPVVQPAESSSVVIDHELIKQLRGLGYIQ